ncbi:Bug family tripartite tricarboxylate transporter substrate binding protein [Paracidovorax sp. MALMAid1276]|uniref:Bug family tripartite tricarboxylate transporter substrate binding protein n=1 Tax=Paracidovorax sp. MALMAid1276 TaxID=3411631 RepID=UPI003B9D0E32
MKHLVRASLLSAALAALASASSLSTAQTAAPPEAWPQRPVRVVVPFPPGGGTDAVARALGQKLSARLGQPVVTDNKPGASTIIGTEAVVKAEPDGHTLLVSGSTSYTVNAALRHKLPYDPLKDLAPVAIVARAPLVIVVNANAPYKDLAALLAAAKAAPRTINYATFGSGSAPHLVGALLEQAANVRFQDVPYRGSAQAMMGLIGGEIQMAIDTVASAAPHVRSGKLRALAIAGHERARALPGVLTVVEQKLPDAAFDGWYAIAAPARTPTPVVDRLIREVEAAMRDPQLQEQIRAQGMEPVFVGPKAMHAAMDNEIGRYRALAHRAQIVVD